MPDRAAGGGRRRRRRDSGGRGRSASGSFSTHVASRLADFKVPSVVPSARRGAARGDGKVQRIGLAERLGLTGVDAAPEISPFTAPRTDMERTIADVWATTLDVERVGVDDDFFSLGGDSVLGAEVVAQLAALTGRELPLTTLMWAPTLGEFAALIEERSWDDDARIVPVRTGGSRPPLFVIHGLWDEVLNIGVLKRTLSPQQPLYAVRIVPHRFRYDSVEEIARDYLREIQDRPAVRPLSDREHVLGRRNVADLARVAPRQRRRGRPRCRHRPSERSRSGPGAALFHQAFVHLQDGSFRYALRRKLRHWLATLMPKSFPIRSWR